MITPQETEHKIIQLNQPIKQKQKRSRKTKKADITPMHTPTPAAPNKMATKLLNRLPIQSSEFINTINVLSNTSSASTLAPTPDNTTLQSTNIENKPSSDDIPYGILKGGKKTGYKTWKSNQHNPKAKSQNKTKFHKTKRTKTIKSVHGKCNNRTIKILIRSAKSRKCVASECEKIKKTSINTIKEYLKKRGLICVGTKAPDDILRKMYESVYLAGDINNKNTDILLHNYINSNK